MDELEFRRRAITHPSDRDPAFLAAAEASVANRKHLAALMDDYHIPRLPAHDALNDAIMTAMLFTHLYQLASTK